MELPRRAAIDRLLSITAMMQKTVHLPVIGHPREKLNVVTLIEIMADSGEFYAAVLQEHDEPPAIAK